MDLSRLAQEGPYYSWHVVLCLFTAFGGGLLTLLSARGVTVRLGFYRAESPSFALGLNRVLAGAQLFLFALFLYAVVLSIGAALNPPAERSLWAGYDCEVPLWSIGMNSLFAVTTLALWLRSERRVPREKRDGEELRLGRRTGFVLLATWAIFGIAAVFLVGGNGERQKVMTSFSVLLALALFGYGTTRRSLVGSRIVMGLSLLLLVALLTYMLSYSLYLRFTIPRIQSQMPELCRQVEARTSPQDGSPFRLTPAVFAPGVRVWGWNRGDYYEISICGGLRETYYYSSKEKKWSVQYWTGT